MNEPGVLCASPAARGEPDFDGATISVGALGAVIDVEPMYQVAQHVYEHPSGDGILADRDAVTGVGTSVSIFSTWRRTDAADQIWAKQRQPDGRAGERGSRVSISCHGWTRFKRSKPCVPWPIALLHCCW